MRVAKLKKRSTVIFLMMFLIIGGIFLLGRTDAKAATGFVKKGGYTYYVKPDGSYHKGFLNLNGKTYYFYAATGRMATGWVKNPKGEYRFFGTTTGVMYKGWVKSSAGGRRYFDPSTGIMKKGWFDQNGKKYYFGAKDGITFMGWVKSSSGKYWYFSTVDGHNYRGWTGSGAKKRYFSTSTGLMSTGWYSSLGYIHFDEKTGYMSVGKTVINGKTYMFNSSNGKRITGWYTASNGDKYYFYPSNGTMATGIVQIDGKSCEFSSSGVFKGYEQTSVNTVSSEKTIKNLLLAAIQPIGSTVYKYGGGHDADATRVGLNANWEKSYKSRDGRYGLDCSGYVGWSVYQVMRKMSTGWSGSMIGLYESYGWGYSTPLSKVTKFYPGDILAHSGHIWMVLGQCSDGSVVVLHSSGDDGYGGPQIAGTSGQAVKLAETYMKRYSGYSYNKYSIYYSNWNQPSNGYYYSTNLFRWGSALSDPDGFKNMTADQILAKLSGAIGNK